MGRLSLEDAKNLAKKVDDFVKGLNPAQLAALRDALPKEPVIALEDQAALQDFLDSNIKSQDSTAVLTGIFNPKTPAIGGIFGKKPGD